MKTTLKFISNDYVFKVGCMGEHGNSILVENEYGKVLFDTAQGLSIKNNLKVLNWNLDNLDAIAISHGHDDHIGGLIEVLDTIRNNNRMINVYVHKNAFNDRVKIFDDGQEKPTGSPFLQSEYELKGAKFIFNDAPIEIVKNIILSGPIPRNFKETDSRLHFQIIDGNKVQDPFIDDQALIVYTEKGIIIIFGCAHAGVINTLDYVEKITGEKSIYGLFGGIHLLEASEHILENTLSEIERRDVKILGFNHCTGIESISYFKKYFSGKFLDANTGSMIEI